LEASEHEGRSYGSYARFVYRHLAPSGKLIVAALAYVDLVADPSSGLTVADVETLPKPTIRRIRHTCITMDDDAGVSRELIRAFTRHGLDTIDQVLKCYTIATLTRLRPPSIPGKPRRPKDGAH
jgi:hypothetical protein